MIAINPTILPEGHEAKVTEWNRTTRLYATASRKGPISVWATPYFSATVKHRLQPSSPVTKLVWAGNVRGDKLNPKMANLLVASGEDGNVSVWNGENAHPVVNIPLDDPPSALDFSPSGQFLALGIAKKMFVWKVGNVSERAEVKKNAVHTFKAPEKLNCLQWNRSGDKILCGGERGMLSVVDLSGSQFISYK